MKRLPLALIATIALTLTACEQKKPAPDVHPIDQTPTTMTPAPMTPGPESDPYVNPPAGTSPKYNAPAKAQPPAKAAPSDTGKASKGKAESKGDGRTYVVQKGDTLSGIAKKMYGDSSKWKKIYEANRGVIKDPKKLPIGAKITIP